VRSAKPAIVYLPLYAYHAYHAYHSANHVYQRNDYHTLHSTLRQSRLTTSALH
jgi:hypothetical protein